MAEVFVEKLGTILVVDDVDEVLNVVVRILEMAEFEVLHANSGPSALKVAGDYIGRIDLLLSDVQMPGMSGPTLADTLRQSRPEIHVILMSAFTGGGVGTNKYGWAFIEKPFVPMRLIEMVNLALRTPNNSPGGSEYGAQRKAARG